ncbi:MAG TPA: glycosyltransferase family 39 protein [Casimicrobiaceae bacterium]|nr:glycosyltransferase family 39 protein [Casimicrobiaceae bacterium]
MAIYVVAGTFGRFPWKADEPYSFGIVWEMLDRHEWLVPTIAGQPFMEKPPLVYWLGASFARTFRWVPPYEATRLAVVMLLVATLAALDDAARSLAPEGIRWLRTFARASPPAREAGPALRLNAILALALAVGTIGFAEHVHKFTADIGQLAGAMIALAGLVRIGTAATWRANVVAGLLLGTGAGLAFMSKGLLVPGVLGVTLTCCFALPRYRTRAAAGAFVASLCAMLPWTIAWPAWLHAASPALFHEWFWENNVGRFVGSTRLGGNDVPFESRILSLLVMGFPALPLAVATVVRTAFGARREPYAIAREAPAHAAVGIYLVFAIVALGASASMRDIYLLPALPPMILLALPTLRAPIRLPACRTFVDASFVACVAMVVAIWLALVVRGNLPDVPGLRTFVARWLPLPFSLRVSAVAIAGVLAAVAAWRAVVRNDPLASTTIAWCAGFATLWIVASLLLLPWIDAARSYVATFAALRGELDTAPGCVGTINLGESELALFAYVTRAAPVRAYLGHSGVGKRSRPNEAAFACPWLLVRSNPTWAPDAPSPARWQRVWTGARPADRSESFALYRAHG